jgi:integrase
MTTAKLGDRPEKYIRAAGTYADGKGLYLRVRAPGQGSWTVKFGTREQSLGPFDLLTPDQVRAQHLAMRMERKAGRDPWALLATVARNEAIEKAADEAGEPGEETFGQLLDEYLGKAARQWKSGPGGSEEVNHRSMFAKAPALLALPVSKVTTKAAAAAATAYDDNAPTQKRMRKRIRTILRYGDTRELKGKKHKVKHHPAMAAKDIPALMLELAALLADKPDARALAFTIHTVPRSGVTLQARWSEITEVEGKPTWIIPKEHMKTEDHIDEDIRIPLTPAALATLGKRGRDDALIFRSRIGNKGKLGHGAMQILLKKLRPGMTVHGMRSSFRDWVGDDTDYPKELGELALAHKIGEEDETAYARGDQLEKRRPMMQAWSDYISKTSKIDG